ncbi:IscS subfamily cysteine desulfurase [Hydrotalea flava]|uniref:IscS subfamily cysteine desulfurase n=1 Tax=Hydrotalea flava TaxID=714549 RepID=UPI000A8B8279|nr:IscS subfamily cysteine desulfurase [Hydrotalea flava]
MLKLPVYLDNNATTPVDPAVLEAMIPFFTQHFGNAASKNHIFGWEADEAVTYAREQVAHLIGAEPNEIIFTSGATESNNLALKGIVETYAVKGNHIITLNTEHKAVLDTCKHLEKQGVEVTYLPVQEDGLIDIKALEAAIKPTTILIAVMYANNEIGVIQPISTISAIAKKHGILLFTDATQAVGKILVDVVKDGIDIMAFSAHKMYGPKGVGALYVRRKNPRVKLVAQIDGGGHERGMRSGTLNVPGIVGLGKACELCRLQMADDAARTARLRNKLEQAILQLEGVTVNGNTLYRLPNVSNLSFQYADGEGLLMGFNKNLAVSSGSACSSASLEPSYVLKALGLSNDLAHSSVRFSLSRFTTEEEIDFAIQQITLTLQELKIWSHG